VRFFSSPGVYAWDSEVKDYLLASFRRLVQNPSGLAKVSRYIDRQEEHHRRGTLSDLLEKFECEEDDWPEGNLLKAS